MAAMFSKPKTPALAPPPPAPANDDSAIREREAAMRDERLRRSAAGRASTMLTGGEGVADALPSARKVLTGG